MLFVNINAWYYSWCAGVVELVSDFVVCEEGKPLSPESSRILVSVMVLLLYQCKN